MEIKIFPNPGSSTINIESKNVEWHYLEIYNAQGILMVKKAQMTSVVNISELIEGIYFIKIGKNEKNNIY